MNNLKDIHNTIQNAKHLRWVVLSGFQWTIWRIYTTVARKIAREGTLFYQDFNEQFEGYTQLFAHRGIFHLVVLSGFQWTIWRIYTTHQECLSIAFRLFYQDFNEQFEGYTQHRRLYQMSRHCCFIRISMNNLKDIHNSQLLNMSLWYVVLSGFQWTIWRIYTTIQEVMILFVRLFYQDFNEQFEGYTQHWPTRILTRCGCFIRISMNNLKDIHNYEFFAIFCDLVVLSGFQWTIWRIYTTNLPMRSHRLQLFYQDFNEQFEGYTQLQMSRAYPIMGCFIRISMNNLKDIHNVQ